ncbi:L,D-transpeptidase [Xenophilus sp. Marseille-Q4582]|uniref:L,D-transpeptidase n=1 Tax=Xenophilus sp. Marseille-Q4582 TaxID=2866600 RepID=UPI001CE3C58B|nr:L,D-transpeptidase [Xenophilus sp. Marseille-Q4582]
MTPAAPRRTLIAGFVLGLAALGAVVIGVPPADPAGTAHSLAPSAEPSGAPAAPLAPPASQAVPSDAGLSLARHVPRSDPPPLPTPPAGLTPPVATLWTRVMMQADSGGAPFVILDKRAARLFVFNGEGELQGQSLVLLGLAVGDDSVPGIGQRPIAQIRPSERTTPAGRFVAEPGLNHEHEDIVWIDYDAAVSMHRLRDSAAPAERRPQRLASESVADNRISMGCVNIPPPFYDAHIRPTLGQGGGVVYVLPETRSLERQFPHLFADAPGPGSAARASAPPGTRTASVL